MSYRISFRELLISKILEERSTILSVGMYSIDTSNPGYYTPSSLPSEKSPFTFCMMIEADFTKKAML